MRNFETQLVNIYEIHVQVLCTVCVVRNCRW